MDHMIGKVFSKWVVLNYYPDKKPGKYYECKCQCGAIKIIPGVTLRAQRSKSCLDCSRFEQHNPTQYIGKVFGKLTIKSWEGNQLNKDGAKGDYLFKCICECGSESIKTTTDLTRKRGTKQCIKCSSNKNLEFALKKNTRHGMHDKPIYKIWSAMKHRCSNKKAMHYDRYGGRGISVCERWMDFANFYEDMGDRPDNLTLDRIDNNGNYEPSNCRWITHQENCNNRYY